MERVEADLDDQGPNYHVTAVGYGVHLGDRIDTAENVSGQETSTIVANALTNHTSKIDIQTVTASGFTLSAVTAINLTDVYVREILNWAAQFGFIDDAGAVWYGDVRDNGDLEFIFQKRPTVADYQVYRSQLNAHAGFDFAQYANRIVVRYNDGASVLTVEDTVKQGAYPNGVNLIKTDYLSIAEATQSADATQAGEVALALRSTLRLDLRNITLQPDALIQDNYGRDIAPWRVKAGRLMQFLDVNPSGVSQSTLAWNNSFLIARSAWDEDSQTLTLEPEQMDYSPDKIVAAARDAIKGVI